MPYQLHPRQHHPRWMCLIVLLVGIITFGDANALCQVEAQESAHASKTVEASLPTDARRSTSIWDAVLGIQWAMVANRQHPEWPSHLVAEKILDTHVGDRRLIQNLASSGNSIAQFAVPAGAIVTLWKKEPMSYIQLKGIAQDPGHYGGRIRVKFLSEDRSGHERDQQHFGIVSGALEVEIQE